MLTITDFDQTTSLRPDEANGEVALFHAELDPTWASLRGVHGGYMTALAVRAGEAATADQPGDRRVRTISTSFLRPAEPGPATLAVESIRAGRSLSTLQVTLRQHGRSIAVSKLTAVASLIGFDWNGPGRDRPPSIERCVPFVPPPSIPHFQHAELLIDPTTIPEGNAAEARIAGYIRPRQPRAIDAAWLAMAGDWFPPSPFRRLMPPAGGISIDYTVHIHRSVLLDPDDWLEGVFEAGTSRDGLALEKGLLSTTDGVAVAETFHSRWTG